MMLPVIIYIVILIHSNSSYHTLNDSQITRCRSGTEPPPVEDTHSFVALHCLWNETKMQSHDTFHPTAWTFEKNDYTSRNPSLIVTCVVASKSNIYSNGITAPNTFSSRTIRILPIQYR